jgi:hypothetical protein
MKELICHQPQKIPVTRSKDINPGPLANNPHKSDISQDISFERIGNTKCSQSNLTPKNSLDHHGNQQHGSVISRTYHTLICFLYHFGRSGSAHPSVHLSGPSTTTQSVMTFKHVPHTLTPRSFMIGLSSLKHVYLSWVYFLFERFSSAENKRKIRNKRVLIS